MKPWERDFEIRPVYNRPLEFEFPMFSYAIFYRGTEKRPNDRYYSMHRDACRGAAQIYNSIEKSLLRDK